MTEQQGLRVTDLSTSMMTHLTLPSREILSRAISIEDGFVSLSKVVRLGEDGTFGDWPRRFALLINKLVDAGKIGQGVLAPPAAICLAPVDAGQPRYLFVAYPHSDVSKEELNTWLGNEAFTDEGDLGSEDWDGLPF